MPARAKALETRGGVQCGLLAAVVPLLGVASACGPGPCEGLESFEPPGPDPNPSVPTVIAGQWIRADILELQFSEGLRSFGPPDPARFAILTWMAIFYANNTKTWEPECYANETRYGPLYGASYYSRPRVDEVWIAPEDDAILRLRLSTPVLSCSSDVWNPLAEGVMLVYSKGEAGSTPLLDQSSEPIPGQGPDWAVRRLDECLREGRGSCNLSESTLGYLPLLGSFASIPCP